MNTTELDTLLTVTSQAIKTCLVTSFGPSTLVIIDRIAKLRKIDPEINIPILTINTGFVFPETLELKARLESKYGITIGSIQADAPISKPGDDKSCCFERKVLPLKLALAGYGGWYTGLRRDQSTSRKNTRRMAWDNDKGLVKIAPLFDWTDGQVWSYILENGIPYNSLHDKGFASIGCWPCTQPGEGREGRWVGQEKTECGIHATA